jgi:hypothetical protein
MAANEYEERAVRTAIHLHPLGFFPKVEDLALCERLVEKGVVQKVDVEGTVRPAYVATDAAVEAFGEWVAMQAERN